MTADASVTLSTSAAATIDHVRALLALPGSQVTLERRGDHYRLRYRERDAECDRSRRKGLELPADAAMIEAIRRLMETHRRNRKTAPAIPGTRRRVEVPQDLAPVLRRILDACPRGRVIRRRIRMVFRIAAECGHETLVDFIKRQPWLATPNRAGRPKKQEYTQYPRAQPMPPTKEWVTFEGV